MERLTIRKEKGIAFWADAKCAGGGYRMTEDFQDQERFGRLAAYEDTGLDPEEIMRLCDMEKRSRREKMIRWEEAEADGRLIVLPCKIGDTIWWVEDVINWHNGKKHVIKKRVCSKPYSYDMLYWIETPIYMTSQCWPKRREMIVKGKTRSSLQALKSQHDISYRIKDQFYAVAELVIDSIFAQKETGKNGDLESEFGDNFKAYPRIRRICDASGVRLILG